MATDASPPSLSLRVTNDGPDLVPGVTPTVSFQHRVLTGETVDLVPGATHGWEILLPAPSGTGTFPAVTRIQYGGGTEQSGSVPLVVPVATPGAPPGPVSARLDIADVAVAAAGTLILVNTGPTEVGGRIVFLLPSGLRTLPETQPAIVPPGRRTRVPLMVEAVGAAPGAAYPVASVLEYDQGGVHHTAIGATTARVIAGGWRARARPLAVGATMLVLTGMVLALASRAARRRAAGS